MDFGSSEFFNNDTLTNDIALQYLSINPNRIANFEEYPKDWERHVEDWRSQQATDGVSEGTTDEVTQ